MWIQKDTQPNYHTKITCLDLSALCPNIEADIAAAVPPTLKLLDAPHDTILELLEERAEMHCKAKHKSIYVYIYI